MTRQQHGPDFVWDDDRYARFLELWEMGCTYLTIASTLKEEWGIDVTRNMLIGKAYRKGLVRTERFKPYIPIPADFLPATGECAFPLGDPKKPGFRYCKGRVDRGSYCDAHRAVAYKPEKVAA